MFWPVLRHHQGNNSYAAWEVTAALCRLLFSNVHTDHLHILTCMCMAVSGEEVQSRCKSLPALLNYCHSEVCCL